MWNMKNRQQKNGIRRTFQRNPSLLVGSIFVLLLLLMAFFPTLFTSLSPTDITADIKLSPPSREHIFGTDVYGRDVFARCIYGTLVDLKIGVIAMVVPLLTGTILGLLAGYYGGKLDMLVMRVVDIFTAFPFMVLVIAIVAILGASLTNLYIAIWCVGWKEYTRLVRSEVLVVKRMEYVDAARTLGFRNIRIILRHILPNVISGAIVYAASDIVLCMMSGASLSYLGLGVQPPTPEWGAIIAGGKNYISSAWWITLFPGLFLMFAGLAFSLVGDGLSDALRSRGQ